MSLELIWIFDWSDFFLLSRSIKSNSQKSHNRLSLSLGLVFLSRVKEDLICPSLGSRKPKGKASPVSQLRAIPYGCIRNPNIEKPLFPNEMAYLQAYKPHLWSNTSQVCHTDAFRNKSRPWTIRRRLCWKFRRKVARKEGNSRYPDKEICHSSCQKSWDQSSIKTTGGLIKGLERLLLPEWLRLSWWTRRTRSRYWLAKRGGN